MIFPRASARPPAAPAFYQNLGGGADMLRLSYSARGDDALSTRDAIPSRDGISTRDGIPAEDADASRGRRRPSRRRARRGGATSSIRLSSVQFPPRFRGSTPRFGHMVSLEQRRAWEEMRRRRAMMDERARGGIARARSDTSTPGALPRRRRARRVRASHRLALMHAPAPPSLRTTVSSARGGRFRRLRSPRRLTI